MIKHRQIFLSLSVLLIVVIVAVFAPILARYDPVETRLGEAENPPSFTHLFGTDHLGRDVFSRAVYGARISLLVGITAAVVAVGIGTSIGLAAGYYGRLPRRRHG